MKELEEAVGDYLSCFYLQLIPNTKSLEEFCKRGLEKCIVISSGRMIDDAEKMLQQWRENANSDDAGTNAFLPVIIVALSRDPMPIMADFSRQTAEPQFVQIPDDDKKRWVKMRLAQHDRRLQIAVFAPEVDTATSMLRQLSLYVSSIPNRRFYTDYQFMKKALKFPVVIEDNSLMMSSVDSDQKNIVILTGDLTLKESVPYFYTPDFFKNKLDGLGIESSDYAIESDGKGDPDNSIEDPNGYRSIHHVISNPPQTNPDNTRSVVVGNDSVMFAETEGDLTGVCE